MRGSPRLILALGIAQRHLGIARPGAVGSEERFDQIGPRLGHD